VLGRRGPAQVAFTSAELRELGHLDGVEIRVDGRGRRARPRLAGVAGREGTFTARKERQAAAGVRGPGRRSRTPGAGSSCASCALPVEIRGTGGSRRSTSVATRSFGPTAAQLRARRAARGHGDDRGADSSCAPSAIRRLPLPDVPFEERAFVLPQRARARADAQTASRCQACTPWGWIKRAGRPGFSHQQARRRGDGDLPRGGSEGGDAGAAVKPRSRADRRAACQRNADLVTSEGLARDRRP